jgi:hypothetical protein
MPMRAANLGRVKARWTAGPGLAKACSAGPPKVAAPANRKDRAAFAARSDVGSARC